MAFLRLYLTGHVVLECGDQQIDQSQLPGRQGRLAFAFLVINRARPMAREELVEAIWSDDPPPELDASLSAILSKLRAVMRRLGHSPPDTSIDVRGGSVRLRLPARTWVDMEEAAASLDEAEGAFRAGDFARAWGCANVVVSITGRRFLPEHEAAWIEGQRRSMRSLRIRGLECLAEVSHATGESPLAVQHLTDVLSLEPFREVAYQKLMRLHAASGNHAEALRVFERCRRLLRSELGADPSPQTEALYARILSGRAVEE